MSNCANWLPRERCSALLLGAASYFAVAWSRAGSGCSLVQRIQTCSAATTHALSLHQRKVSSAIVEICGRASPQPWSPGVCMQAFSKQGAISRLDGTAVVVLQGRHKCWCVALPTYPGLRAQASSGRSLLQRELLGEKKGHYGHLKPVKHEHKGHYGVLLPGCPAGLLKKSFHAQVVATTVTLSTSAWNLHGLDERPLCAQANRSTTQ